jgi:hypothetical protein
LVALIGAAPGSHARHDYLLKWRESREIGGFTRFTVLK